MAKTNEPLHRPARLRRILNDLRKAYPEADIQQEPIRELGMVKLFAGWADPDVGIESREEALRSEVWSVDTAKRAILAQETVDEAVRQLSSFVKSCSTSLQGESQEVSNQSFHSEAA
eukprot:TRINITY_DN77923_c0_g1_i1.p1 TRINITY_DN77923_c0_g1~~TRINITY_DN77923_c0_g1_i1.p1  ORF type:complete len:117 (+),score=15.60 TRINITY_DN77923_c0_g1_i1:131-481(+)